MSAAPDALVQPQDVPGEPAATLVWPVGLDGNVPRALYDSHGEWVGPREDWKPTLMNVHFGHQGIDVAANPGEAVYAVEDGQVVAWSVSGEENDDDQYFVVSRGSDLQHGIKYMHVTDVLVNLGDPVHRDDVLGYVDEFSWCPFDHLHLQAVTNADAASGENEVWDLAQVKDDGNPLLLLAARNDDQPPTFEPLPSTFATDGATLLFLGTDASTELSSDSIDGPVLIVAKVHDTFPGEKPDPADARTCGNPPASEVLAPLRIELQIVLLEAADDSGDDCPVGEVVYSNTIDFSAAVSTDGKISTQDYYVEGTKATYSERSLCFVLTHDSETGSNVWTPSCSGIYGVEVRATDASHNVTCPPLTKITVDLR